ncbi:MAG: hypothetical protein EZS28_008116, partial [Streblomastix strix]
MIAITFEEYLRQCPLHPNRLLRNIFNNFFSGRIIEFFASVDDIGDKEAILHLKNAVQQDDMIFILKFTELTRECSSIPLERGVECFIRARLLKYGQNGSSHELSAVIFDGNEVPDYTLSPSVFCSYFGQNVLQQFKINFDEFWHQQYIPITGIFFSIDEVHEPGDIIAKIQFRITQPYVDEVNDPVILLIRKGLQQLLNIAQKYLRKGNVEILTQPESQQENMHVMNFMEFIAIKSDAFTPAQKTPLPFILPYVDYYPELVSIHLNLLDFLLFLPANQESRFNLINNSINLQFLKTSIFQTQIRIFLNLFTGLRIIQGTLFAMEKGEDDSGEESIIDYGPLLFEILQCVGLPMQEIMAWPMGPVKNFVMGVLDYMDLQFFTTTPNMSYILFSVLFALVMASVFIFIALLFVFKNGDSRVPLPLVQLLRIITNASVTFGYQPMITIIFMIVDCDFSSGKGMCDMYPEVPCWEGMQLVFNSLSLFTLVVFVPFTQFVILFLYEFDVKHDVMLAAHSGRYEFVEMACKCILTAESQWLSSYFVLRCL